MARCSRCNKIMLFSADSIYCEKCLAARREEERIRKKEEEDRRKREIEEARNKAEEIERKRFEEACKNKTLTPEEYYKMGEIPRRRYLRIDYYGYDYDYSELEQRQEAFFSQPYTVIKETYDRWIFGLYKRRILVSFSEKMKYVKDDLERQVYEKEIAILQDTVSIADVHSKMTGFPHQKMITDYEDMYCIWGGYIIPHHGTIRLKHNDGFKCVSIRADSLGCVPYIAGLTKNTGCLHNLETLLSKEEYLLYRMFLSFTYHFEELEGHCIFA